MPVEVKLVKEADDPLCTRVSMGGTEEIGYYVVYRGKLVDVLKVFERCHIAVQGAREREIQSEQ